MQGTQEAITQASQRGYEAVVLVITMLGMLAFFAALGRWFIKSMDRRFDEASKRLDEANKREERLAARITTLEAFVEQTLIQIVRDNSKTMELVVLSNSELLKTISAKPCLLDSVHQDVLIEKAAEHIANRLRDRFEAAGE